ncbi:mucin-binding protein, partial [Levilactobacillus brevis]
PDGPKWPEGTDKSSVTQTVIRTVNYLDKQTGKVVAKQVTEQVTYNRTAIVDKVTGQIIGYSTTGGDTVDQTDGDKAWTAVDNKSDWDSVTSPDLSSKGYLAPDLATVAQQTVTPGDKDVTVNVYYDHDVVPVNPTNPQTPGTPINPDDPDSPKWPAGPNQPGKPGNGTDTGNSSSNQPGNPSQPSNVTNNGVINTSTNTESKVNNGAVNSPELPQTGENNSQSQTMSFIGILLAMFGSLLGFLGIKKRRND